MKIGILGTGEVGRALAPALHDAGNDVVVGTRNPDATRRDNDALREVLDARPGLRLSTFPDAAAQADIIVNALPGPLCVDILKTLSKAVGRRILMDISSPFDGKADTAVLAPVNTDSLGEQIQRALPRARVVKTLNTMAAELMSNPDATRHLDQTVFTSGDDPDAKQAVAAVLRQLGWHDVLDLGPIHTARAPEMLLRMWIDVYKALDTDHFGFKIVRNDHPRTGHAG
ncbi:NADPH-dependent F420 reductase [Streptomyces xanthochromogenes]|uniref:NADPH-dependent F420 reductase n=1 Tax=Streptomyces xanthochromogenes TaxID=67384 RepID=UPI00343BB340